jgi:hypothetical protein
MPRCGTVSKKKKSQKKKRPCSLNSTWDAMLWHATASSAGGAMLWHPVSSSLKKKALESEQYTWDAMLWHATASSAGGGFSSACTRPAMPLGSDTSCSSLEKKKVV